MTPTVHQSNNATLGKPEGVSDEDCQSLAITRAVNEQGVPIVISYWMPDALELERLNAGKAVALGVWGNTHAPLWVQVDGADGLPK